MSKHTTYVEFFYCGALVDETSVEEALSRDPGEVDVPPGAFAFRFFERESMISPAGNPLSSPRLDVSGFYYPAGRLFTAEDVKRYFPDEKILLSNMENNDLELVVLTRKGNFKPFEDDDVLVTATEATGNGFS
jgi:hypothetical protein